MNNLYELGGSVNILLKVNSPTKIGDKIYQSNEPYTILKDVTATLRYETITSNIDSKKPTFSSRFGRPSSIAITDVQLTTKILNLIFSIQKEQKTLVTTKENVIASGNNIYLNDIPKDNIFIYDINHKNVEYTNIEENIITGNFNENEEYLVFYDIEKTGKVYSFEAPQFPYFSLEISGQGNINKSTSNIYCKFPAAILISIPNIDFINSAVLNTPLVFNFIYKGQKEPIIIIE